MTTDKTQDSLSHIDASGRAQMVDVSEKPATDRVAIAEGCVDISAELAAQISANTLQKGDLLTVARIAGIGAAKRTDELIPLCHSIPIDHIAVDAWLDGNHVRLRAEVRTRAATGVEMEALSGVMGAALTVIDMGKSVDRTMTIHSVRVIEKRGGRRGDYLYSSEADAK